MLVVTYVMFNIGYSVKKFETFGNNICLDKTISRSCNHR